MAKDQQDSEHRWEVQRLSGEPMPPWSTMRSFKSLDEELEDIASYYNAERDHYGHCKWIDKKEMEEIGRVIFEWAGRPDERHVNEWFGADEVERMRGFFLEHDMNAQEAEEFLKLLLEVHYAPKS